MTHRINVSLDDMAYGIVTRSGGRGNQSAYIGGLLNWNWARWRKAYDLAIRRRWAPDEIRTVIEAMAGWWMIADAHTADSDADVVKRAQRLPSAALEKLRARGCLADNNPQPVTLHALETLSWEWWQGNIELRALLDASSK